MEFEAPYCFQAWVSRGDVSTTRDLKNRRRPGGGGRASSSDCKRQPPGFCFDLALNLDNLYY